MSKIGFCGLGKLGLPVALAVESKGHEVYGFDVSGKPAEYLNNKRIPYTEDKLQPLLDKNSIKVVRTVDDLVKNTDMIFVPVQTPHDPKYEGVTPLTDERADFDYTYLKLAIETIAESARIQRKTITVSVISTCLPGTYKREVKPLLNEYIKYVYTPQFIAMGTVLEDYLYPEFNLIGVEDKDAADQLERFYATINDAPNVRTDITTAEGIKVSYNTWITAKTVVANTWGEIAQKSGMNFNDIKKAWDYSGRRLWSTRYTDAGMSDGGGCHPRDNIAMSWYAKEIGLSHNIFDDLMKARDDYEHWHALVAEHIAQKNNQDLIVLGRAFKPETNIETGSPSRLMFEYINIPAKLVEDMKDLEVATYFIGTKHDRYKDYKFPQGSNVIDPFGYIPDQSGARVIRLGRK